MARRKGRSRRFLAPPPPPCARRSRCTSRTRRCLITASGSLRLAQTKTSLCRVSLSGAPMETPTRATTTTSQPVSFFVPTKRQMVSSSAASTTKSTATRWRAESSSPGTRTIHHVRDDRRAKDASSTVSTLRASMRFHSGMRGSRARRQSATHAMAIATTKAPTSTATVSTGTALISASERSIWFTSMATRPPVEDGSPTASDSALKTVMKSVRCVQRQVRSPASSSGSATHPARDQPPPACPGSASSHHAHAHS
mmetsp:Transcript_24021/g.74834  ORF Transcript_24021/g.74834 Transcript_24021/m.74834 type:complete len:255 (+) Transcript_24021:60-824(+)